MKNLTNSGSKFGGYRGEPLRQCDELSTLCEKVEAVTDMLYAFSDPGDVVNAERGRDIMWGCYVALSAAVESARKSVDVENDVYKLALNDPRREDVRRALAMFMRSDYSAPAEQPKAA